MRFLPLALVSLFMMALVPSGGASHVDPGELDWACGFGRTPDADCGIQAIDDPSFTTNSWISGHDQVIGIKIGGEARAYPTKMLDNHEIVTDNVGGTPVAVTWCPLCGSAIVFERIVEVDGQNTLLTFGVSGYLYKHDLVMFDPQTETLWTQIDGTPIASWDDGVKRSHPEARLTAIGSELTTWKDWRERHPGTRLLSNEGRNYGGAYPGYEDSCRFGISGQSNCNITGLHPKEQVIGVELAGQKKAYPVFGVRASGNVVMDEIAGMSVVVVANRGGATAVHEAGGHTFTKEGGAWVDEKGREWDLLAGAREDGMESLDAVDQRVMFWFAWKEHHPNTELWLPPDVQGEGKPLEGSGAGIPGPGWALGVSVVVAAVALLRGRLARR